MELSPFIPHQLYKRSVIHDLYGGNRQSGICPSTRFPYIFIFSGKSGQLYGYNDGWDHPDVFTYSGEGQVGDMKFTKGNLALKEHLNTGKRVFLFESDKKSASVRFITELEYFDSDFGESFDVNGNVRVGIKFFFKRKGAQLPYSAQQLDTSALIAESDTSDTYKISAITERIGLVTTRVGQGAYRKRLLHRWEYKCAVTGFNKLEILIASHIVPWSTSTHEERQDVHNGLLLSPVYDALFDKHLISFDAQGAIILSSQIEAEAYRRIGVTGKEKITKLSEANITYLSRHQEGFV